jgi:thiol-disulfide isomerase/thioredoxin
MLVRHFALPLCAVLALALISVGCDNTSGGSGHAAPAGFDTRPYAQAKQAAEDEGKWFIVKATAVWCPPCKQMNATSWPDPEVVAWIKENGIAVAVDVDREAAVAQGLGVEAMPTIIAFHQGKEVDRFVGMKGPDELRDWLKGLTSGR